MPRQSRLWYRQSDPAEAARIVSQLGDSYDLIGQPRKELARRNASMFEGIELNGLDGDCFDALVPVVFDGAPLVNNRCEAIVETLQAKLAALDEPRPQFVVTDGTYEQQRQAVWLDRFVEGQYYQPQGMWTSLWQLWRHAFLIAAAATGSAAVKIYPHNKRIVCELRHTLDMWVDPMECRYGFPLTYGDNTWVDAELLADEHPDLADEIMRAATSSDPSMPRRDDKNDALQVCVRETWRVQTDPDQPGKYCRVVGTKALDYEDYSYPTPPFVFYHFKRRIAGFWGRSASESFYQSNVRENQVLARMDEAEARSQTVIQYYDPNVQSRAQLSVPKHIVLIPYDSTKGTPPQPFVMPWYAQQAPELMRIHAQNAHDVSGVASMQVTGQAQTGLTAAVAIRTVLSLLNERLAPQQRDIVQAQAVDSAYLIARAARELHEQDGEFSSYWYGSGPFVRKLPGTDCLSLPSEICTVQVRPVSEKKNSPADRVQLAQELVTQGIITGGDWVSVLQTMDTMRASRRYQKTEEWCEKLFDSFLYAPSADLVKPGFYRSPPKYLDLDYTMALATDAYLSADIAEVPDERKQLLLKFLGDCDRKIDQRDARRQQLGMPPRPQAQPGQQQDQPAPQPLPAPLGAAG